jgi:hypothetical protein
MHRHSHSCHPPRHPPALGKLCFRLRCPCERQSSHKRPTRRAHAPAPTRNHSTPDISGTYHTSLATWTRSSEPRYRYVVVICRNLPMAFSWMIHQLATAYFHLGHLFTQTLSKNQVEKSCLPVPVFPKTREVGSESNSIRTGYLCMPECCYHISILSPNIYIPK